MNNPLLTGDSDNRASRSRPKAGWATYFIVTAMT